MTQLATTLIWWAAVLSAYFVAEHKGRNRLVWTVATMFVPIAVLALFVLRPKTRVA